MDSFFLLDGFEDDEKHVGWSGGTAIDSKKNRLNEAIIGRDNFKQLVWLEKALDASKRVAKIDGCIEATGFMIAKNLFITNHHVFDSAKKAARCDLWFNYRKAFDGKLSDVDYWRVDSGSLYESNEELDYAIVKVFPNDQGRDAGDVWGYFDISIDAEIKKNERANIIQHPEGRKQEIAFRDNQIKAIGSNYLQYVTDTQPGSSGSPVLNDDFEVIAMHSGSIADPDSPDRKWYRNHGFLISAIYEELKDIINSLDKR